MARAQASTPAVGPEKDPASQLPDLAKYRRWFRAFEGNKAAEIDEAQESRRYYHSKQYTEAEIAVFRKRKQPVITDNRIKRKIDALVGVEQRMRRDPKGYPRNPGDTNGADVATAALRFVCDQERWEQKASEGAHNGFTSGIGCVWVGIEAGRKGNDVKIRMVEADRFFYDPRSTKDDFSDARFMGVHLWLDIDDAVAQWPDQEKALREIIDTAEGSSLASEEDRAEQWGDFEQNRVRVVEIYERRPQWDHETGRVVQPWYYSKFSGGLQLEGYWSPYLDEDEIPTCPYEAWTAYIDEKGQRYGEVRAMRPMQDEINHRRSKLLHYANTNQLHVQNGTKAAEDVDALREQAARPDGIIVHDGEWGKETGVVDKTMEMQAQADLLAQAESSIENYGPNPGLTGKGGGVQDQSGRAILAQRDSGLTELSPVFDRLRGWKLRVYRAIWARIKQAWTEERYIAITDDPRAPEFLGINQYSMDPMTGHLVAENVIGQIDVDIILDEGPDTIIMQEEMMQTLARLGEAAMGPLGKILIELSNMPNKETLLKHFEEVNAPPPEVIEMQQRMAKLEEMLAAIQVDEKIAGIEKTRADTVKTLTEAMAPPQVMQAFPFQYGQPGVMDTLMMSPPGQQQPPPPEEGGPMPLSPPEMDGMNAMTPPPPTPMGGMDGPPGL